MDAAAGHAGDKPVDADLLGDERGTTMARLLEVSANHPVGASR